MKKRMVSVLLAMLLMTAWLPSSALALEALQIDHTDYRPGQYIIVDYTNVTQADCTGIGGAADRSYGLQTRPIYHR